MKRTPRFATIGALAFLLMVVGCSTRIGDLTAASTKNLAAEFNTVQKGVEGSDCSHWVLFIPFGTTNPTIDGAVDDAIDSVEGADALTDAVLKSTILVTLLYNQIRMKVSGTAISTR